MTDAIVARIMRIRNGMTTDEDAEAIIEREIAALQPHERSSPDIESAVGERGTRANQAPDVDPNLFARSSAGNEQSTKQRASKILFGDPAWLDRPDMADQMDDEFVMSDGDRDRRITPNQLIAELNAEAATPSTPEGLADFVRRCRAYLEDCPGDGGHSDAAGSTAYELIEEAIEHCTPDLAQPPIDPQEPDYKACFFDTLKMLHEALDAIEAIDSECLLPPQLQDLVDAALVHRTAYSLPSTEAPAQPKRVPLGAEHPDNYHLAFSKQWTADQFWQFAEGLTDAHVRDQLRDTLTERGLSISSTEGK